MVTMKDVAKKAEVSIATVSRVLADHPSVTEQTKQAVIAAIEELDYCPNKLASGFRQKNSKLVAVLVADITNPFCTDLLKGVDDVLCTSGFIPLFHDSDNDEQDEEKTLANMRSMGIAGALIEPCKASHRDFASVLTPEIPFVCLAKANTQLQPPFDAILHDYAKVGYMAAMHLLKDGRKNIVCLVENSGAEPGGEIQSGYAKAMEEYGLAHRTFLLGDSTKRMQSSLDEMVEPLNGGFPDGIVVGSDVRAAGVMRYLAQRGVTVPGDTAVISFGNTLFAKSTNPVLASIGPSGYQVGMMGAQKLISRINGDTSAFALKKVEPKLIMRGSCQ